MKTKYIILLLFLSLYVTGTGVAQIELPESTKKALENYNKEQEEKEPKEEEKNEKTIEKEKAWEKMLEEDMEEFKEASSYFDTKGLNCIFLTVLYLDGYLSLVELTNSEKNCQRKYDLLGTQAVAIGMSTMVLYCPEYLAGLTEAEKDELLSVQLASVIEKSKDNDILGQWVAKFSRVLMLTHKYRPPGEVSGDVIDDLTKRFHPQWIVSRSLNIAREMEALGCGDY